MLRVVAELLRGRPENKRRRGKHREQPKEYGLAKGRSVAYGSPKKKDSVDNMSSREGATATTTGVFRRGVGDAGRPNSMRLTLTGGGLGGGSRSGHRRGELGSCERGGRGARDWLATVGGATDGCRSFGGK